MLGDLNEAECNSGFLCLASFAASAQGGGVVLGAGTSFGLGVDLDGKVEVMVAPKYGSESQLDSVVTSVRVAL